MIRIKVCGLCDPLNVREIVVAKPDFMGFIFYPRSPRFVGAEPDMSLFRSVPPGILKTGVFVNENPSIILDLAYMADLDIIQLHGNESPDSCSRLKSAGLSTIKAFSMTDNFDFESVKPFVQSCDYFMFDTKTEKFGGSGKKFNWDKLTGYDLDKPFFLSGGIGPDDAELMKTINNRGFFAVDVNSRFETDHGKKNFTLVKTFIDRIKNNQK